MSDTHSALEEIQIIRRMILDTRRHSSGLRIPLMIFGALGMAASLASHALLVRGMHGAIAIPWLVFFFVGLGATVVATRRSARGRQVVSFVDRALQMLWIAIGASIVLMTLLAYSLGPETTRMHLAAIACLIAVGLTASAKLIEWAPLYAAAALWWFGAVAMTFLPEQIFVIEAICMFGGYLVPAYFIHARDDASAPARALQTGNAD